MNSYLRRTTVVVLAVALSLPAFAVSRESLRRDRDPVDQIVRVFKKIQRVFGISKNDDLPQPPVPTPPPPPTNPHP